MAVLLTILVAAIAMDAGAARSLLLTRGTPAPQADYKGVFELTVEPLLENARVTITLDGQKIAEGMHPPYRVIVDFGSTPLQHKIGVLAVAGKKRVQWSETINRGHLPLSVKVTPVDLSQRLFEAKTTCPSEDAIAVVELWDGGDLVASVREAPYRFTVPQPVLQGGIVQVTARTRTGEEAADFWSPSGDVHVESLEVRTVPIFVSVVDRNGITLADVDRSLFRILDNNTEAKIIEFGKAFDQPISIALLLDSSASMTYSLDHAAKAAAAFVERTLREGDRCSLFAVQDVPRRKQSLTSSVADLTKAMGEMAAAGRTALYDGIASAIRELSEEKHRRAMVILTDGGDTASISSYEEIEKAALQAGIPIYFIAYETGAEDSRRDLDRLKHLATLTGGFVAAATQQNLHAKYREIENDLRAQFAIRYQITDFAKRNEWRRIHVQLKSPKLTARTIRGYFAP